MWIRMSLRFRITVLVVAVVATGTVIFGRFAYTGLGQLLSGASVSGAQTAAEAIADSIDAEWLRDLNPQQAQYTPEYERLGDRLMALVDRGTLARISVAKVDIAADRVTHVFSLPADGSRDYQIPGTSDPTIMYAYFQAKQGEPMLVHLYRPGLYMIGRAPIMWEGEQVGAVLAITDVTNIKSALNAITLGIAAIVIVIVLLAGMVSYKFASSFEKTAVTDGLMGIYNHKYFKQRLEEEVAKARRYGQPTSLVLFDIDFFKKVNDTYGHATGDLVLKLMAKWVTGMCRTSDVICRYGGEEIACILPHTGIAGAQEFAERLRIKISEQVVHDPEEDARFRVTVSVGVAQWEKGMELTDLIRATDAALYHSKRTGRNRVTIYHDELLPAPDMASKPERTKDR